MEEDVGLTKVFVDVWVLFENNAVDLKLEHVNFLALLVVIKSQSELVAFVRKVERNIEGLGKAFGMPALFWLAIDVESD